MAAFHDPSVVFLDGIGRFRLWPLAFADDGDGIAIPCAGDAQPVGIVAFIGIEQQECDGQAEQHRDDLFALIAVGGGGINCERPGVAVAQRMNRAAFAFIADVYAFTAASSRGKKSRQPRLLSSRSGHINRQKR